MLKCPVCHEELKLENKSYVCKNHHCFDVAKQGYVNLSRKQKKDKGDNSLMVQARTAFLEKNYYDFMRQYVKNQVQNLSIHELLDTGCGQGYYTQEFSKVVDKMMAMDLSKSAIQYASGHDKTSQYFIGSIFDIPLFDESVDGVVSIFVPNAKNEIHRILKLNGYWIQVGPGPSHCWELKEVLYERVRENPKADTEMDGFKCIQQECISQKKEVDDVNSLLEMTPYLYKSPKEGLKRVKELDSLEVTFEFVVSVWKKI